MSEHERETADEILNELTMCEGGYSSILPTIENHCNFCNGACEKRTKANVCQNCGEEGTLYISWQPSAFYVRECRQCGDCC